MGRRPPALAMACRARCRRAEPRRPCQAIKDAEIRKKDLEEVPPLALPWRRWRDRVSFCAPGGRQASDSRSHVVGARCQAVEREKKRVENEEVEREKKRKAQELEREIAAEERKWREEKRRKDKLARERREREWREEVEKKVREEEAKKAAGEKKAAEETKEAGGKTAEEKQVASEGVGGKVEL